VIRQCQNIRMCIIYLCNTQYFWAGPTIGTGPAGWSGTEYRPSSWSNCLGPAQIGPAHIAQTAGLPSWTGISPNTVANYQRLERTSHILSDYSLILYPPESRPSSGFSHSLQSAQVLTQSQIIAIYPLDSESDAVANRNTILFSEYAHMGKPLESLSVSLAFFINFLFLCLLFAIPCIISRTAASLHRSLADISQSLTQVNPHFPG
jgi:hypothetical protein